MSTPSRKTAVIIGVSDVINRSKKVESAIEPLQLMINAIQNAIRDTGLASAHLVALQSQIDSIYVVKSWTWPCDYPTLIADRLAFKPLHKEYTDHGGNQPARCVDDAARRISLGESKLAIVTGGEALASLSAFATAKRMPPPGWTPSSEDVSSVFSPTTRQLQPSTDNLRSGSRVHMTNNIIVGLGAKHSIGSPIQIYPLYENSFRFHNKQSVAENHAESAQMYAEFAKVAEKHQYSWNYGSTAETTDSIGTVSKRNRIICFPYPLLMNAHNTVNLAAACLLTSTDYARELGVPSEKWIYPLGGAGCSDSVEFWQRPAFWWAPSISRSLDAGIAVSSISKEDIDLYDFYSCFPIVPKLACAHLGLPTSGGTKPITLLGGLTSFGGAGNNYSLHAITEMTRQLRQGKGKTGLVLANGGWVTYQHVLCLSSSPRSDGLPYPNEPPLPRYVTDVQIPTVAEQAEGDATVETYTVEYDRNNRPIRGHVVGRLKSNGHRFLANHADDHTLNELASWKNEQCLRSGRVTLGEDGRNLFSFLEVSRL